MSEVTIWGKYKNNPPEVIDRATKKQAEYLVGEYRIAFGKDWIVWAGTKNGLLNLP